MGEDSVEPGMAGWLGELRGRIESEASGSPCDDRASVDLLLLKANHGPCVGSDPGSCLCGRPWPCPWVRRVARRYGVRAEPTQPAGAEGNPVDRRAAGAQRARVARAAESMAPGERLWLEVRPVGLGHPGGRRWRAAVCRPGDASDVFAGTSAAGAVFDLEHPSQLAVWLESLHIRPTEPVPAAWEQLLFFGCDADRADR